MTPETKNMLENMPPKKKAMIVITAIVVIIVIWQVMGLFGNKTPVQPPATFGPPANMNANAPGARNIAPMPGSSSASLPLANPAVRPQPITTSQTIVPKEVQISKDQYLQEQEKTEKKYLKQLNDLEQLKLERQIEETNQAIATAKLATVTAEKNTADLLTKPIAVVPATAYANQLVSPTRSGEAVAEGPPPVNENVPPPPVQIPEVPYSVISVSMQFNKWTAVIGAQGKLYNVSVGDVLPPDGSVVASITKSGVVLRKENKSRKISMTTAI